MAYSWWINPLFIYVNLCLWICSPLVLVMDFCLFGTTPLHVPFFYILDHKEQILMKIESRYKHFLPRKYICKHCLQKCGHFIQWPTVAILSNGLAPGRRQAIIWTNAGILLIRPVGTNFNEILIEILTFSFMKMRLKVSSAKRWPFCLSPNVLIEAMSLTRLNSVIVWESSFCQQWWLYIICQCHNTIMTWIGHVAWWPLPELLTWYPIKSLQWTSPTTPTMHLFHIPQCTIQNRNVHISVLYGALWDMEQVHCGICELDQFIWW